MCSVCAGHEVFKVHAQLLRGTLHALWRMEAEALRDLQVVINIQGQPSQVRHLIVCTPPVFIVLSEVIGLYVVHFL